MLYPSWIRSLEQITRVQARLSGLLGTQKAQIRMLMEVPGIHEVSAQAILGELGDTLAQFPNDAALAGWAGLCPGNHQSAGKRQSGKSPVRGHHFKTIMVEVAWGAIKTKGSYYRDKYYRLKARLGAKKAIVAIARRILKAVFRIIKFGIPFRDLGETFLVNRHREARLRTLHRQAALLGYQLVPVE